MRSWFRAMVGLVAACMLIVSTYQIYRYRADEHASEKLNDRLIESAVFMKKPEQSDMPSQMQAGPLETAPIQVDFGVLKAQSKDIIAWLYCEDTEINYPIAQAGDNEYYLRRLLDGSYNREGTLFADYRNAAGFSDWNTIVYGHNMKNSSMFGTLTEYSSQEYYEKHPVLWLLTEEGDYKLELIAGYVTPAASDIYSLIQTADAAMALAKHAMEQSTFTADVKLASGDRFVTLSTCSYAYENARYVLLGRLTPLQ